MGHPGSGGSNGRKWLRSALVLPEWIEAGLAGAFAVIAVFFVRDAWFREPFYTPAVLGTLLVEGLDAARWATPAPGAAAAYNVIHFIAWIVMGLVASQLMRRAEDDPRLRWLPVAGLVVALLALAGADLVLRETPLVRTDAWMGGLAGLAAMGGFLAWRHPGVFRR
jgi:hypothetical protein